MKKLTIFYAVLCLIGNDMYAIEQKPWTFLVYMAASNELYNEALKDLQDMMKVGSNQHVNILVYLTIKQKGRSKETRKLYVERGEVRQIGPVVYRDGGDVSTLVDALQWACLDYPSDYIAVNLWSGKSEPLNRTSSSLKGFCYDSETGHYLTDKDCVVAFSWVKNIMRGGKNFDIILCDACLLGSLEIAYAFAHCANYYVASEEFVPHNAFHYISLLRSLGSSTDVYSFVKSIVNNYGKIGNHLYTLSAIDLNELDILVHNVNAVAHILSSQLRGKHGSLVKSMIKKCIGTEMCPSFEKGIYIDLHQFYKNLFKISGNMKLSKMVSQQFKQLLQTGIDLFSTVVKMKTTSKQYKQQPGGLSIYFNKHHIDPSYYGLYWTEKNPQWLDFLEAYLE